MAKPVATYDRYLADFRTFETSAAAKAPDWLRRLRQEALSRFSELGFPTARKGNEPWKYTSVAPIGEASFSYPFDVTANVKAAHVRRAAPWDDGWPSLVFVDGRIAPSLSTAAGALQGARLTTLAEALRADGRVVQAHLGRYAPFQDESFTALNTAFLQDGAFVHVPEGAVAESPLHLLFVTAGAGEPIVSYPRALIVAERHSRLTLIETYAGPGGGRYFTDAVTEIVVGEGAQVEHYRLLLESPEAFHVGVSRVQLERDATFTSVSFARGAAIGRADLRIALEGPGSSCFLHGLYMTRGTEHVDNYINIDHAAPHTTSRLYYKGILDGRSRGVFGGIVLVRPEAVKTDALQKDKNLILSDEAEVDSKPSLEIYADDVLCGHGATAGAVAEDALFYMRSRGLSPEAARLLLIKGFASEITEAVRVGPLRAYLERLVEGYIPNQQTEGSL